MWCGVLWCMCGCLSLGRVSCLLARNKSLRSARDLRPFASLVSSASFDEPKSFVVLLERRNKKQPNFILYPLPRRRPPSRETWCRSGGRRISPPLPACVSDWEKAFSAADRSPLFFHNLIRALPPSLPPFLDGWNGQQVSIGCMHTWHYCYVDVECRSGVSEAARRGGGFITHRLK